LKSLLVEAKQFMNTITNKTIHNIGIALAMLLLVAVSFAIAPKAQAADLTDSFDFYPVDGSGQDSYDFYPMDSGYSQDSYDFYPMDSGFSDYGYSGGMGGFTGGWSFGGGGYGGGSGYSSVYAPTNTSVFAPTNTCTATNSCNTTTQINAPTNIVTNTTAAPSYPVYQPVYTQTYVPPVYNTPVYYPAQQPIAYNNTPYVTLAAVPYTGLELGTMGTIAYWGFLVLWCLIVAYLIVVKKIQNKIAAWFTGSAPQNSASQKSSDLPSSGALRATPAGQTFVKHNSAPLFTGIDSFVLSQINRA